MRNIFILVLMLTVGTAAGQTLVGKWQLVKQSSCIEEEMATESDAEDELVTDMKSMAGAKPQIIEFRENNTARESTKIIDKRKTYNSNALLYKYTGSTLYFLDKKSRILVDSFTIEQLSADSLIISNTNRVCETRVFVKLP